VGVACTLSEEQFEVRIRQSIVSFMKQQQEERDRTLARVAHYLYCFTAIALALFLLSRILFFCVS